MAMVMVMVMVVVAVVGVIKAWPGSPLILTFACKGGGGEEESK